MSRTEIESSPTKDFTIPEGCPLCGADLPVRVTASGARGVCRSCGWFNRPEIKVNKTGLEVTYQAALA